MSNINDIVQMCVCAEVVESWKWKNPITLKLYQNLVEILKYFCVLTNKTIRQFSVITNMLRDFSFEGCSPKSAGWARRSADVSMTLRSKVTSSCCTFILYVHYVYVYVVYWILPDAYYVQYVTCFRYTFNVAWFVTLFGENFKSAKYIAKVVLNVVNIRID